MLWLRTLTIELITGTSARPANRGGRCPWWARLEPPSNRRPLIAIRLSYFMQSGAASDVRIWVQKTFCDAKHLPPWLTPQCLCDQRFIAGTSHPNEPRHWLQAFLQTSDIGPSNSISTLGLSNCDYKACCGSFPTGMWLIFHALRYLLQTIRPHRLFLLMWKMWGCFIHEKEPAGTMEVDVVIFRSFHDSLNLAPENSVTQRGGVTVTWKKLLNICDCADLISMLSSGIRWLLLSNSNDVNAHFFHDEDATLTWWK